MDPPTKILLIGDSGVGKSSLLLRFTANTFDPDISSTIGIDFRVKQVDVMDREGRARTVTAQLWDTAGQERFRTLTTSYYRGAKAVVLVYAVDDPSSFEGLQKWLTEAKTFLGSDAVYLLIGNKTDKAADAASPVPPEDAKSFARSHQMMFALCSAKTREGVMHAFEELVRKVYDSNAGVETTDGPRVNFQRSPPERTGGGCC